MGRAMGAQRAQVEARAKRLGAVAVFGTEKAMRESPLEGFARPALPKSRRPRGAEGTERIQGENKSTPARTGDQVHCRARGSAAPLSRQGLGQRLAGRARGI